MAKQTSYIVGPGGSLLVAGRILSEGAPVPDEAIKALGGNGLTEAIASKSVILETEAAESDAKAAQ
jgi:hypothetical protein